MDIKAKIEELVEKIKNDKSFGEDFKKDPIKAVEKVLGVDLPDEQIKAVVDGIMAKGTLDDLGDKAEGIIGKIKDVFHKD